MDSLLLLQYTCFLLTFIFAMALAVSFFQQGDVTAEYRKAHWMLLAGISLFSIHYLLQMACGLRARSDEVGTVVNILFYTPGSFLVSTSMMRLVCGNRHFRRYVSRGSAGWCTTTLVFAVGWLVFRDLRCSVLRYVMHLAFLLSMVYYIAKPLHEIHANRRRIIDGTGGDITQYERFMMSGYLLLCATSSLLVFAILWRKALFVIGPLLLLSLFLYVLSFIALGYNVTSMEEVLVDDADSMGRLIADEEKKSRLAVPSATPSAVATPDASSVMSSVRADAIKEKLASWVEDGGFRDSVANIGKLAQQTGIPRAELTLFFYHHLRSSFRVWLSDIRFSEAQRMIKAHPEYSNDAISSSCGFSSRSQLYKIFSDRLGMSPREWYERQDNADRKGGNVD